MINKNLTLSVHQLVDFLLRAGDIDNRVFNSSTMNEGTKIHAYYQAKQGKNYLSEYFLSGDFKVDDFNISLEGRADGIIDNDGEFTIDEIKSTIIALEEFYNEQKEWHLGQAKCYALLFARERNLTHISIKLTYINQLDDSKMVKYFDYLTSELENDIAKLLKEYIEFYKLVYNHFEKRNKSSKLIEFPYKDFRPGQKKLAKYAYGIGQNGGILFAEAPTGIGKTISTLFPFIKTFATTDNEKIFYLTAKNSGKEMAFDAVKMMQEKGLDISTINISARDKICLCPGKACNPDDCPFAKGYYSKIKDILIDSIKNEKTFSFNKIVEIAKHYAVCPFELSLDLSLFVDIVICDYNYFFDPMVYLKRYFDRDASKNLVLVDEAHNLVERGRNMYSAQIDSYKFKVIRKHLTHFEHKKIQNAFKRMAKVFNQFKDFPIGTTKIDMFDKTSLNAMNAYLLAASDLMKKHNEVIIDEFKDFYFELNKFIKLLDFYDDTFTLFVSKKNDKDCYINLYCIDPSKHLKSTMDMVKGKIIFSATLSPSDYYINMLGGSKTDPVLFLPSPFKKENLKLLVAPKVSIKYKDREQTLKEVADYIHNFISGKVGNYFIYVPSYEYLESLIPFLYEENCDLMIQEKDMNDEEKQSFLSCFVEKPERTTIGLAVIGGAFSEGIDLVGERIIGVVVVGVGLPQICFERDEIKDHFNKVENKGFDYAYVSPGLNKVMQAVGRLIRSEDDKGVALLIDDRYLTNRYLDLYKGNWSNYEVVTSKEDVKLQVDNFWNKN